MKFITASVSKAGGRKENQDYLGYTVAKSFHCWVVADGLGGHRGGNIASQLAVGGILEAFEKEPEISQKAIKKYLEIANKNIVIRQEEDMKLVSMRTTIVLLIGNLKGILWGYAGDTRFYHFRNGQIIFQTKDHSVPQALVDGGKISFAEIRHHEDRNRLLRSIGNTDDFRPNIEAKIQPIEGGDAFLLCTDGFWDYVTETEMEVDIARSDTPQLFIEKMEERILIKAKEKFDNYSAIAVFVE